MKRIALMLSLAVASAAWGQAPKPAAPEAAKPPAQEAAKEPAKPAPMAKKSRRSEDARRCLEQPTNTAIIKCAEEYL